MIIRQVDQLPSAQTLNIFPNQFVTDKEKGKKLYIKKTLDYFGVIAYQQYQRNCETFVKNYSLMKGIITMRDFYDKEPVVKDFMSQLSANTELPDYVKHYPIINSPVNTMVGELSKRPDSHRVRAFDDDSKSEELEYKTSLVQQLILQQARQQLQQEYALQGQQLPDDQLEQLTTDKVKEYLTDYTSLAERWANHVLTAMKPELQLKDKSEEAFRDLLIATREFFHIYEDNSKRGFSVDVANPKNVFHSPHNDKKYSRDWYFGGTIEVMEISEIIEKVPGLTKEEIDWLVMQQQQNTLMSPLKSNLESNVTGPDSITYNVYNRYLEQQRAFIESELNNDTTPAPFDALLNTPLVTTPLSYKYPVLRVYWLSKKLVGKLTYQDETGQEQVMLVDENYQEGTPGEVDIEWGWVNQWYQGFKIGTEIYIIRPFKLLDYCPLIGVTHEVKNTMAKSLVDLMKPLQAIYNICMNQLWRLLEKEIGVVYNVSLKKIPVLKDGDHQDSIDAWEAEAREKGIVFEDDSPENMRAPSGNTNLSRPVDLSRSREIQSRYELAAMVKNECLELVGMSKQRMGGVAATETATGTQTALTQSFAQTEPYFAQHEYVMTQLYQGILDAAQYVESTKEVSTLSYITAAGESAFLQVTAPDIRLRDLHVFATSSPEDIQLFNEIRQLSQAMLQNGATPYDIVNLYSTNSIRQMKGVFKSLKEQKDQMEQTQQQQQQQQLDQQQQQFQAAQQEMARQKELDRVNDNINKEKDRQNRVQVAIVTAMGHAKDLGEDTNSDGMPDMYQTQSLLNEMDATSKKHQQELSKLNLERQKLLQEGQFRQRDQDQRDEELAIQKQKLAIDKKKTPKKKT